MGGNTRHSLIQQLVTFLAIKFYIYLSGGGNTRHSLIQQLVTFLAIKFYIYLSGGGNTRHSLIQQLVTFLAIKFYIYLSGGGNTRHSLIQQLVTFLAIKFYIYLSSGGQYSTLSHTAVSYLSSYQVLYLSFWWGGNTRHSLIQQLVTFLAIKFYIYLSGGGQYSTLSHTAAGYLSSYQVLYLSF